MSTQNAATSVRQQLGLQTYELDPSKAIEIQTYLADGFVQNKVDTFVKKPFEDFEAELIEATDDAEAVMTKEGDHFIFRSKEMIVVGYYKDFADKMFHMKGMFYSLQENFIKVKAWVEENRPAPKPNPKGVYNICISHMVNTPFGRQNVNHNRLTSQFDDLRDDFYPLIDVPMMTKLYSEGDENILILTGEPGTGKTCFVKKSLRELAVNMGRNISVKYVKDIDILKDDSFWADLSKNMPDVLVLDDLDDELLPRTEGRNEIVNHLLSFSDGLFDVKTKVIITTNLSNSAIDSAITRPGRCFEILALPQLTIDQAKSVWKDGFDQTDETFAEVFGDEFEDGAKISQAALMSEYKRFIKVGPEAYLKDTSISIREVIQNGGTAN